MLRNSKVHYKSSELYPILSMHFGESMNLARIKAMSLVICALCKVQRVAYTKLASALDTEATAGSSLRRSQRLIAECVIYKDLIAKLILKLIPVKGHYNLAMDRTDWKYSDTNINILTLGIIYDGMAFHVVYTMMDKRGNSNTQERIDLVNRFKRIAGEDSIAKASTMSTNKLVICPVLKSRTENLNCRFLSHTAMQMKRMKCTAKDGRWSPCLKA